MKTSKPYKCQHFIKNSGKLFLTGLVLFLPTSRSRVIWELIEQKIFLKLQLLNCKHLNVVKCEWIALLTWMKRTKWFVSNSFNFPTKLLVISEADLGKYLERQSIFKKYLGFTLHLSTSILSNRVHLLVSSKTTVLLEKYLGPLKAPPANPGT